MNSGAAMSTDYEVFLSFRGPDTRLTFTDCLYEAMNDAGIRVFRDDEELRFGEEIGGGLLRAINSSKIWIPIFSKGYASSIWCLQELAHMVECKRSSNEKEILPIFYDVEASDVKLRTELYDDALKKHEKKFGYEKVQQWKEALREVARIRGWDLNDRAHGKLIKVIVQEVLSKLKTRQRILPDHFIGMDDQVEAVMDLLDNCSMDIRMVVIHGMGGIGKTTLTKVIFNKISSQFQSCSFLSNVRESAQHGDIVKLQKQLLSDILKIKSMEIYDTDDGINMLKERCRSKKVFIVLDDIDQGDQLVKLGAKFDWFGSGSRIIITTRNMSFLAAQEERLLDSFSVQSQKFYVYEMREMRPEHALQLFSMCAFRTDLPPHDYYDLSSEVVATMGGLPLALEVVGSFLHRKSEVIWKDTLKKLKKMPHKEVQKQLMISYEALEYEEKQIFLDIACFFVNQEKTSAMYMWEACEFFPESGIIVLVDLSLIKIVDHDVIWMHDQLRDLGREIVHQESFQIPEMCSRLWSPKVGLDAVRKQTGTENAVALVLWGFLKIYEFSQDQFSKLPNLRFLELHEGINFVGDFENHLSKLRWLAWHSCHPKFKATNFNLRNLVVLNISKSGLTEDWGGWSQIMMSSKLKVLNLTSCGCLTKTPDFSSCLALERVILKDCESLVEIDSSIGKLQHLSHLTIDGCNSLRKLPDEVSSIRSLTSLVMKDITGKGTNNVKGDNSVGFKLPELIGNLKNLSNLEMVCVRITDLPCSIGQLKNIRSLSFSGCSELRKLPDSMGALSLVELDLSWTKIAELPESIGHQKCLSVLELKRTPITTLPNSIGGLIALEHFSVHGCLELTRLPDSIGKLKSLLELDLSDTGITELPDSIGNLKRLKVLKMNSSEVKILPIAIGLLENLEELQAGFCRELAGEIPSEIGRLSALRILDLSFTQIHVLPKTINQLCLLQKLNLQGCNELQELPELPASLISLNFQSSSSPTFPNLCNMTNLVDLFLSDGFARLVNCENTNKEVPDLSWIVRLSKLENLALVHANISMPPPDLGSLPQLRKLVLSCHHLRSLTHLPQHLSTLEVMNFKSMIEWSPHSCLKKLSHVELNQSWLKEMRLGGLGEVENLRTLTVFHCEFLVKIAGLSSLKNLKEFNVSTCSMLVEIQGLEELDLLEVLRISECGSMKRLPDASKLKKMKKLDILYCASLKSLPDLSNTEVPCSVVVIGSPNLRDYAGPYKSYKFGGNLSWLSRTK